MHLQRRQLGAKMHLTPLAALERSFIKKARTGESGNRETGDRGIIQTSNKCLTSNKKLAETSATLVETRSY